jgi:ABC-type multidrug transport system permease subunit
MEMITKGHHKMFEILVVASIFSGICTLLVIMIGEVIDPYSRTGTANPVMIFIILTLLSSYTLQIMENINLLKEKINILETENASIKQQAVNAGLGYWKEEIIESKKIFTIASHTSQIVAEETK